MKTNLFSLFEQADKIIICGYEAEEVEFNISYGEFNGLVRLTTADEVDYYFAEQEVVLADGEVTALDQPEDPEEEPTEYRIGFKVERLLCAEDLIDEPSVPAVQQEKPIEQLRAEVEAGLAELLRRIDEPMSINYGDKVYLEVCPPKHYGERVNVCHRELGWTCINYTSEGLILDVFNQQDHESLQSYAFDRDDLMAHEEAEIAL